MSSLRTIDQRAHRIIVTYAALAAENGDAFDAVEFPDKTIQASGTGTVTVQGTNDGTNWVALKDPSGAAISLAAATNDAAVIAANPKLMRAVNAGGSSLVVITGAR